MISAMHRPAAAAACASVNGTAWGNTLKPPGELCEVVLRERATSPEPASGRVARQETGAQRRRYARRITRNVTIPTLLAALVMLAGCGGGESPAPATSAASTPEQTERYLETDLPKLIAEKNAGDSFTGVQCIHRESKLYDCAGTYQMGLASAKASMAGIDTSNFAAADWAAVREQSSGAVSYEVLVGEDGAYNITPK